MNQLKGMDVSKCECEWVCNEYCWNLTPQLKSQMLVYRVNQNIFLTYSNFCDYWFHQTSNEIVSDYLSLTTENRLQETQTWEGARSPPAVVCPAEGVGVPTQRSRLTQGWVVMVREMRTVLKTHTGKIFHARKKLRPPGTNAAPSCISHGYPLSSLNHSQMYEVSELYFNIK